MSERGVPSAYCIIPELSGWEDTHFPCHPTEELPIAPYRIPGIRPHLAGGERPVNARVQSSTPTGISATPVLPGPRAVCTGKRATSVPGRRPQLHRDPGHTGTGIPATPDFRSTGIPATPRRPNLLRRLAIPRGNSVLSNRSENTTTRGAGFFGVGNEGGAWPR
jgi:hypothetical protein